MAADNSPDKEAKDDNMAIEIGTIYSYPNNPRVYKMQAVANLNGLTLATGKFHMGETNKSPDFLAKFPLGKAPAFSSTDGVHLFESNAIAQYLAESGPRKDQLLGSTPGERATIAQWVVMSETEIMAAVVNCFIPRAGIAPYIEAVEQRAVAAIERALGGLEKHLAGQTWLATKENISLADIAVASSLVWGFKFAIDAEMRAKYPGVVDWYREVTSIEGVKEAFGETMFIEKREIPK